MGKDKAAERNELLAKVLRYKMVDRGVSANALRVRLDKSMSLNTMYKKLHNPGEMRVSELWDMFDALGVTPKDVRDVREMKEVL